jgi:hypothetical protein
MDANGASKTVTPWGAAKLIDELTLPQRAGEKRFAYSTGGTARRGPVTLRLRDLERLRAALAEHPDLAEVLRLGG